jgi:hypothetical protein
MSKGPTNTALRISTSHDPFCKDYNRFLDTQIQNSIFGSSTPSVTGKEI